MWNEIVKANCSRDSRSAVISIVSLVSRAVDSFFRGIDDLVGAAVHHRYTRGARKLPPSAACDATFKHENRVLCLPRLVVDCDFLPKERVGTNAGTMSQTSSPTETKIHTKDTMGQAARQPCNRSSLRSTFPIDGAPVMQKPQDDSKACLTTFVQDGTLTVVIEMSLASWLVAEMIPSVKREPRKKINPDPQLLLQLLYCWKVEATKAGKEITRIAVAYEIGRDGFWLARWLRERGIDAHVIHATSVAVSREHRRAKTDRIDTAMLQRGFLGWLRGEPGHCSMATVPTVAEEDGKCPCRERESARGNTHQHDQSDEVHSDPVRGPQLQTYLAQGTSETCRCTNP